MNIASSASRLFPKAEEVDFTAISPGSWLLKQVPWTEGENHISAIVPGAETARLLDLSERAACLKVERTTWQNGRTVTFVRQVFDGAHYSLVARFKV
ncbi:MAG: UTRA domain-containing protein [Asticcacaulis sp.]